MSKDDLILVTGATGYVGGRIVPRLLESGRHVRVLARDATRLQGRPWLQDVEVCEGDVLNPETLSAAMQDVKVAYYLIHSMSKSGDFRERDLVAARNFGHAASGANVERIIYLGGLGDPDADLSTHLRHDPESGAESGIMSVHRHTFRKHGRTTAKTTPNNETIY
ncbi:MAG: NAD(P)H-binding protein [Caldilineales bacterium]|nr:NAD(P)H-binding protein [Caldilineales bacterium]